MPSTPEPRSPVERRLALDPQDRRQIEALLADAQAADGHPALSDDARLELLPDGPTGPPGGHGPRAVLLWHDADGALGGFALLRWSHQVWVVEVALGQAGRRDPSVLEALLDASVADAGAGGGGTVRLWLRAPDERSERTVLALGFAHERDLLQLRVPLPLDPPARSARALPVRAFRPGLDDEAWLRVNNRAFADHPEQSGWTLADLVRREGEPWFDAAGFLLYETEGRLAGFCWTKVHRAPVLGEIYVIGVDPDFQGRGLGRALTVAGLAHLAGRGLDTGMLYVEGTNHAALGMYRSLGFTTHHLDRAYLAHVPDRADRGGGPPAAPAGAHPVDERS